MAIYSRVCLLSSPQSSESGISCEFLGGENANFDAYTRRLDKQKHIRLLALAFSPVFMGVLYEIIRVVRSHRQRLEPLYTLVLCSGHMHL